MFRKPYKVKTSTTMKGSDRKMLRNLVETQYSSISQDDINILISNKNDMNQVKAMAHNGHTLVIYYFNSEPMFFILENQLYPTVYSLWKYLDLLPTVTTVPPVLEKICNGADLMAPGIVINELTIQEMRNLKKNDICAIKICGNKSPIAIGIAVMSINDLCTDGIKGKAVTIVHNYKDNLWSSGSNKDLPIIDDQQLDDVCQEIEDIDISQNTSSEEVTKSENDLESCTDNENTATVEVADMCDVLPEYTMDEILYQSFMAAIKIHGRKIQLPVLTSTFYSSCVLKSCPSELNLDIKKTSYKKLSVFLKKMVKEGILQIKELTKGVESIVAINLESENIKSFMLDSMFKNHIQLQKVDKSKDEDSTTNIQENYKFPLVAELFVISAQVKKLFETANMKKGDSIPPSTVRDVLKTYVKNNNLQNENNPRELILDPLLADCLLKRGDSRTSMNWEEAYEAIVHNMPHAHQITFDGKEPVLKKGKLEPIKVTIDKRTGNKKVTLIQNLEVYGINPEKIAHHAQVAVAASTSITTTQNGKGTLVLIQGNQILYLQKLFFDTLKVPKKYTQGLENAPAKKKS